MERSPFTKDGGCSREGEKLKKKFCLGAEIFSGMEKEGGKNVRRGRERSIESQISGTQTAEEDKGSNIWGSRVKAKVTGEVNLHRGILTVMTYWQQCKHRSRSSIETVK